jgi:hypothetical protein
MVADVEPADVIAPQDENVWFCAGHGFVSFS